MQIAADLVEVRPLRPFVGSYRCSLSEADMIEDGLAEADDGSIVKVKIPRKRFVGLIPVQRAMRDAERALLESGKKLPESIEVIEEGRMVIEHPAERTVKVPPVVADGLIERGLAVLVKGAARRVRA